MLGIHSFLYHKIYKRSLGGIAIKTILKISSFLIVALCLYMIFQADWFVMLKSGDMDLIADYFEEEWQLALFITFILMLIQNLFTLVPLVLVVTINILLFGFYGGFFWSWATSVMGSLLAFLLYRYWLQTFLTTKVNSDIRSKIENNGFLFVFYARLFPFFPTSLINVTAGASTIKIYHYVSATVLGNLIYLLIVSLIVNGIVSASFESYVFFVALVIAIPLFYLYKRRKRKVKILQKDVAHFK